MSLCGHCSFRFGNQQERQSIDSGIHVLSDPRGQESMMGNLDKMTSLWEERPPLKRISRISECSQDSAYDDLSSELDNSSVCDEEVRKIERCTAHTQTNPEDFFIIPDTAVTSEHTIQNLTCRKHKGHLTILFCGKCERMICTRCHSDDQSHTNHPVTSILAVTTGYEDSNKLSNHLEDVKQRLQDYVKVIKERHQVAERHMKRRKRYYEELVERWYWRNMMTINEEHEKETSRVISKIDWIDQTKSNMADVERRVQDMVAMTTSLEKLREEEISLADDLQKAKEVVEGIEDPGVTWQQLSFVAGRCQRLTAEDLGTVLPCRTQDSVMATSREDYNDDQNNVDYDDDDDTIIIHDINDIEEDLTTIPQGLLPSRKLHEFDSRHGMESDYMATGITLTDVGHLLITDSGLNTIQTFSATGVWKGEFMVMPDDQLTKAVPFGQRYVAVAGATGIMLYDAKDGLTSQDQLKTNIDHPQGMAVSHSTGDLVVSGYHNNLPVIAFFDNKELILKDIIYGTTKSSEVREDMDVLFIQEEESEELFSEVPWYIAINEQSQDVVISNRNDHMVCTLKRGCGKKELLSNDSSGINVGSFQNPAGLHVNHSNGHVIVADSRNHRVQLLTPDHQRALVLLSQEHDGIECPMDVVVDKDGRLYVLQGDGIVKVFQYL